jgi:hypothetical protein
MKEWFTNVLDYYVRLILKELVRNKKTAMMAAGDEMGRNHFSPLVNYSISVGSQFRNWCMAAVIFSSSQSSTAWPQSVFSISN